MKKLFKNKLATVALVIITIALAGVAVFTAIRLYQLRQESVSPTTPSEPEATGQDITPIACESVAFTISTENTPTPTGTVTLTPSPTPTQTPTNTPTGSPTETPTGTLTPTQSPTPTDKPIGGTSPTSTPTPTATATQTSTPTPTTGGEISAVSPTPGGSALPDAGVSLPTLMGFAVGLLLILGALLLAI
jgi:cytoskeletal protein RodZ